MKKKCVCTGVHISFHGYIYDDYNKKYGLLRNKGILATRKSELTNKPQCYKPNTYSL